VVQAVIALDAANCTGTGLPDAKASGDGVFDMILLDFDRENRDNLMRAGSTDNGRFGSTQIEWVLSLLDPLGAANVGVFGVATDADAGTNCLHEELLARYFSDGKLPSLKEADELIANSFGRYFRVWGWQCIAISDFLHLAKAVRLMDYLIKMLGDDTLPLGLTEPDGLPDLSSIDGEVLLSKHPRFRNTSSTAHVQDGPALQAIRELLLQEWRATWRWRGVWHHGPWSFLNLAIRAEKMSIPDRLAFLGAAFDMLGELGSPLPPIARGSRAPMWMEMQWVAA
jgi:hypothetical protein